MTFEMRNLLVRVRRVDLVKQFFIEKMGYRERPYEESARDGWVALDAPSGSVTMVLRENTSPDQVSRIIINTDDCLKDYYFLRQEQFSFRGEPRYFSFGLAAEFTDEAGNIFMLLEERVY